MTKTAEKPYPLGAAHTYIAHKREYPSPHRVLEQLVRVSDDDLFTSAQFYKTYNLD